MNTLLRPGAIAVVMLLLAACGATESENKGDLAAKKAELQKLKAESDKLGQQIRTLEEEISKLDSTAAVHGKLVEVNTLEEQNFTHYIDLQGRVVTEDIYLVTPRGMGGQVQAIYVKEGNPVRKGQLLMKLDDGVLQQQIAQAKINLDYAKDIYSRRQKLWEQNIGTQVELNTAKNNVANLEKQLSLLNEQLSYTNVYAEASGIVESVTIRVGETFTPATANMAGITFVNPRDLKVSVSVPENYLARVKKGTDVVIEIPDVNKTINSKINLISQLINANSRGFTAEAKIAYDPALKPNQLATVKIKDYAAANTIVIPLTTLQTDQAGKYVYVLANENGKKIAHKKPVVVGEIYGEEIEVKEGLQPGDKLITKGFQGLYEGQVITTTP